MPNYRLSKSKITEGLQCVKRIWLSTHRPDLAVVEKAVTQRLQAGLALHEVYRSCYPKGHYVDDTYGLGEALRITKRLLADGAQHIFEATFAHQEVLVRADLITKENGSYNLYEVKSSTSVKDYQMQDAAIQAWVISNSIPLGKVFISHIDNAFVYFGKGNYHGLFFHEEITDNVKTLQSEIPDWIVKFKGVLSSGEPTIVPDAHCFEPFECPYLAYCSPTQAGPDYPVEILPGASRIERELVAEGYVDLRCVPRDRLSDARHLRMWDAVHSGTPQMDAALRLEIEQIAFPRFFLDFETITFAAPIWAGTRPYQQLPFQYSCHIEQAEGEIKHLEFLDLSGHPPMRSLAEKMIADLGVSGPIVTYGHFERMIIGILIELFPDLHRPLADLQDRIVDLLPLLRQYYYHPDMAGSWSIKAVLPTIAPDLTYDTLEEVHDGMEAQAAFLEAIHEQTPDSRRQALREHLLKYCGQDSWAMVRIVRHFSGHPMQRRQ